ncbi:Unknown protein, partial [Striga hermonthica]
NIGSTTGRNFVSMRDYYAYKLQIRENDESCLLNFGRLFQQYIVDMYVKIESQRLDFFRKQQAEIRQEFLQGIQDCLAAGETNASKIGQRVFLPASFIGGPRNMKKRYLDAMTLVQRFGKPDIFLTMTCNPNWPEIKDFLKENEESQNRPDLVARVFRAKFEELKKDILKINIFGEVVAYTYVIEFQKRGLPHAHMLIILANKNKLYKPEEFDKIVSAEIPDKRLNTHLYNMVKKHMMHGPCGDLNPNNSCMNAKNKCRFNYPKQFSEFTMQGNNSYPKYQRRDNNVKIKVRGCKLDNRWVVPYSPYLLAKFNCHINVEICSSIRAVKYIYKYICKGHDKIAFHVDTSNQNAQIDEIEQFRTARWVSPPEAAWRIYRFPISETKPAVINLPVHLENYQTISYRKRDRLDRIANNPRNHKTMLTEFFFMNRTDPFAKKLNLTYIEFPEYFVWLTDEKKWKIREGKDSIARIVTVHPNEGERYYLKLLLLHVRGPKSYKHIKSFNNIIAKSYHEAALARGLLQDDNTQELCLEEASLFKMPYEMRRLFANLLVYSCPNKPADLFTKFEEAMSEDFVRHSNLSKTDIKRKVLEQINGFLESMGKNIHTFNILPPDILINAEENNREITVEKNIVVAQEDLNAINTLNQEQKMAFTIIQQRVY